MSAFNLAHTEVCRVERDGFALVATVHVDDRQSPPWEEEDGHGPVSDWTTREPNEGERVLCVDRQSRRYYDVAEALVIAQRDGWGPDTPEAAVAADFARLKAWCDDDWWYVGVAVTVRKLDVQLTGDFDHALWGIESDAEGYLGEVAEELAGDALKAAKAKLAQLCEHP